jgi:prevent-host-death family protein
MQVNVQEAETKLSKLLELVELGETVVIARDGKPVAELVPVPKQVPAAERKPFPFGIARNSPLINPNAGDEWWQPMTDQEVEDFIDGKY